MALRPDVTRFMNLLSALADDCEERRLEIGMAREELAAIAKLDPVDLGHILDGLELPTWPKIDAIIQALRGTVLVVWDDDPIHPGTDEIQ